MILINLLLLFIFENALVIVHEFSHALVATLMRFRVLSVSVGYGKRLASFMVSGIAVSFHLIPLGGLTKAIPGSQGWIRLRYWLFTSAGIVVHVILALTLLFFYPGLRDVSGSLERLLNEIAPVESLFVANLILLVLNAIPHEVKNPAGAVYTDGYQLLTIPFWKNEPIEKLHSMLPRIEAQELLARGEIHRAREIFEAELEKTPEDRMLKHDLAIASLHDGNFEDAYNLFKELLFAEEFQSAELRPVLANNIAWTAAVTWKPDLLPDADRFSSEAFRANPDHLMFRGTRGTVLIRLGEYREGIDLLKKVYTYQSIPDARAFEAFFIAIGFGGLGNPGEAFRWLRKGVDQSPQNPMIPKIQSEVDRLLAEHH